MSRAVSVDALTKAWDDTKAVDDISFHVEAGTLTVLLGPSGCGKSTSLRIVAGLDTPTSGRVTIGGDDVTHLDPAQRGVSMVFQSYALFPHLSVAKNILFGLQVRGVARAEQAERLDSVAKLVGLSDLLERKPAALSGGQRQRVALARAIIAERPVCLMDEPLSNLDAKLRAEMRQEVRRLQQELGMTMIYVTHDQTEAMTMADQIILMRQGNIEQAGSPKDLYQTPATAFAAGFIGSPPMNLLPVTEATASLPGTAPAEPGWTLGVRPESIAVATSGINANVLAVEHLGAETMLKLKHEGHDLVARADSWIDRQPGDQVNLTWNIEDTHLFDAQGNRRDGGHTASPVPASNTARGQKSKHRSQTDASDVTHSN